MPTIPEYTPGPARLHPTSQGFEAFETLGRRVSPIFNQQARYTRQGGALAAETEQLSFKTQQIIDALGRRAPLVRSKGPGGSAKSRPSGGGGRPRGDVARGAGALARALAGGPSTEEDYKRPPFHHYDPETGLDSITRNSTYGGNPDLYESYTTSGGGGRPDTRTETPYGDWADRSSGEGYFDSIGAKITGWMESVFGSATEAVPAASADIPPLGGGVTE